MNSNIKIAIAFSLGVAAGVAASWRYMKTKYERLAQESIDDVKEKYRGSLVFTKEDVEEFECDGDEYEIKPTKQIYEELVKGYTEQSSTVEIDDDDPYSKRTHISILTPEAFGDIDEYNTTTLYYYEDGILTDLEDNIIEDVEGTVGEDFADHFGEYEDDSVHVRNDDHKCDYEILKTGTEYGSRMKPANLSNSEV